MTPQLDAAQTISRVDIFRRRALKIERPIPRCGAVSSTGEGGDAPRGACRPAWRTCARSAIIPCLSSERPVFWRLAKKADQHAPGRFHSGAQVVKETEQAAKHHAKVASRLRVREASRIGAAGFRFNITGNPHD
jgi:hypothetical protein